MMSRGTGERGAVMIVVALCLTFGLLGVGALAVDLGSWYSEKAQVQNGADAAALAVGQSCAAGSCDTSLAAKYAGWNANDGANNTPIVCGSAPGASPGLPSCSGTACPAGSGSYVSVGAVSDTPQPSLLGRFIPGNAGNGETLRACTTVSWGPAGYPDGGIALTISYCDWKTDVGGDPLNPVYAPAPPWPPYPSTSEKVLQLGHVGDPTTCAAPTGGSTLPGGFGELTPNGSANCTTMIAADGYYTQATGNGNSDQWVHTCDSIFASDVANRTVVFIPVFNGVQGSGNTGQFHLDNMAAFVITGYRMKTGSGSTVKSTIPGTPYGTTAAINAACPDSCLIGYFVNATDSGGSAGNGSGNYGATVPPKLTS